VFFVLSAGLALAATSPSVSFDTTIGPPPAAASFDIGFVKNDIGSYILADRTNKAVDLFNAKTLSFTGGIGSHGFVGVCTATPGCSGPDGDLIDSSNHVWVGDGPAADCSTAGCACFTGETTSMLKEYTLAPSIGATGRLACIDTGGKARVDEMAFDPRDKLLIAANDDDGFLNMVQTTTASIANQFFYADNDLGKPATVSGLSTPGGGIEQPVWNPQQGFFYLALPQGATVGRLDVFNPKPGKLVFLRSINVPGCTGGPSGLALDPATNQFLGACANGVALIDANSGRVTILGSQASVGGADELWFDPGSNAWYISTPNQLGVVSADSGHAIQVVTHTGCCGHSVAAYTANSTHSFILDPNRTGTGISVFSATP
jgi:hypothetical protein